MSHPNTIRHASGELLTGRLWRKDLPYFNDLPFYSDIPRMDKIAGPLQGALVKGTSEGCFSALLVKLGKGLDSVHPFSDTIGVDVVLREANIMLSADLEEVGKRNAGRIWGLISNFVILDRLSKTLGVAKINPGRPVEKRMRPPIYLGTGSKILESLNPPTKLLAKFLKTWEDREKALAQYIKKPLTSSVDGKDTAGIALSLSRRLIAAGSIKNIANIETGLEMIALAIAISSENNGVFPESRIGLKNVLQRMWLDRMNPQLLEDTSDSILTLHKSMKNVIDIVFAISPLLALSTHGWSSRNVHSTYLLRIFLSLGNNRPQILVYLEDCVLKAIIAISEGISFENAMNTLYSEISSMEKDLANDNEALTWFNLSTADFAVTSTPPLYELPSTPSAGVLLEHKFQGSLASPPESHNNSPIVSVRSMSASHMGNFTSCRSDKPRNIHVSTAYSGDDLEQRQQDNSMGQSQSSESGNLLVDEDGDDPMISVGSEPPSVLEGVEDGLLTDVNMSDDKEEGGPIIGMESNQMSLDSGPSVHLAAPLQPRRSSRNVPAKNKPSVEYVAPRKCRRKTVLKMDEFLLESEFECEDERPRLSNIDKESEFECEDERPRLSNIDKATYHPTLYADIVGWGSTVDAGPKSYRHVPVQILPPGNVASVGDDTETLRRLEARIQGDFINGLPPHLQPNAKSMEYVPGSDQSRIFVASYSEFSSLHARDVQNILRERLILVHGTPSDYKYGWDLDSFGRLYDVDKKINVHVSTYFHPFKPELRHRQATLREFHQITTTLSKEECPPLNAISLPSYERNLHVPCQFGSVASHEVAQSRLSSEYKAKFQPPDVKSHMEWSLIGSRGTVSPFHVDSEGLGTVVIVLEGSKYWILATRFGKDDIICSVDSLGPTWNPYFVNDGDNVNRFSFEGVHLQKSDMLIMPGGVPHWVLGTSNSICVGRHFYAKSTIRSSVITTVHTFLHGGAVTNQDYVQTRTLLYQLLVFWSMRIDKTDVDGAHIPDLSTEEGLFDLIYLGIFVILSPAFDARFYTPLKGPPNVSKEWAYALFEFRSLLQLFSLRFIILLDGVPMAHSYVVERMLGEFAAAAVAFSKAIGKSNVEKKNNDDGIAFSAFAGHIELVLQCNYPKVFPYFSHCLDRSHKHFLWTGPDIQIFPRSEKNLFITSVTSVGEMLDYPAHRIYHTPSTTIAQGRSKKRKLRS